MNTRVNRLTSIIVIFLLILGLLSVKPVQASSSVELTDLNSAYLQDFNSLATSGESALLPEGWQIKESGTGANTLYTASPGNIKTPDTFSFGSEGSTDRALGGIRGDAFVPLFGASFTNHTGEEILSVIISYTGEQWRAGRTVFADKIIFEYSTTASALDNGTWVEMESLTYLSASSDRTEAKDGNSDKYHAHFTSQITGLHIAENQTLWIRWTDYNKLGEDDGLSVDDFSLTPTGAENAPGVTSHSPADGETGVAINATLTLTFSEAVTMGANWFTLTCTESGIHNATVSGGPKGFTLTPDSPFDYDEDCTLAIHAAQVSDQDSVDPPDTMEQDVNISFSTQSPPDAAPGVSATFPVNGQIDYPVDGGLEVNFSEAVALSEGWFALECAASGAHTAVVTGENTEYQITPDVHFAHGEVCTFTIFGDKVTDLDHLGEIHNMPANFVILFTTLPFNDPAPFVESTLPANGQVGVDTHSALGITFSEPVEVQTGWVEIACTLSGTHTAITSGGSTAFSLTPATSFYFNETCSVKINASLVTEKTSEGEPQNMLADQSFSFDTQTLVDNPPALLFSTPVQGASSVAVDSDMTLVFSEPVETVEGWFDLTCELSGAHSAKVTLQSDTIVLNPDSNFKSGETCLLTVNHEGVTDLDGNPPPTPLEHDTILAFSTDGEKDLPPFVVSTTPVDGAMNVPVSGYLSLAFSEPVTLLPGWISFHCSKSGDQMVFKEEGPTAYKIAAGGDLRFEETCTIHLYAASILDRDGESPGDPMNEDHEFSFTTAAGEVDLPPFVVSTTPADGAVDVPVSGYLSLVFSEPVTLSSGWISFHCSKSGDQMVFKEEGPTAYKIAGKGDLGFEEICTIHLFAASIIDRDGEGPGDPMSGDHEFSFTTAADANAFTFPTVVAGIHTRPANGESLSLSIRQISVQFSEDVLHDGSPDAANNPANYRLISAAHNNLLETESCEATGGDDVLLSIDQIHYDSSMFVATLSVNQGSDLPDGFYRLLACGTHTIRNAQGKALNNGADTSITFQVKSAGSGGGDEEDPTPVEEDDGNDQNNDETQTHSSEQSSSTLYALSIPVTGFAPGHAAQVSEPPAEDLVNEDLWVEIPAMEVAMPITGVPHENGEWDVSWLAGQAGWLEGSAYPTSAGNSVLTGHVWDAFNRPGSFFGLEKLQLGDRVILHSFGSEFVYEVRQVLSVLPSNTAAMLKHRETAWITLVTCQGFDETSGEYERRVLVRAELVEVRER